MHVEMDRKARRLIYVALALATVAAYWRVGHFDFVNFDDPEYVSQNYYVRSGLTWVGIRSVFTSFHAANWHPLAWLSHMLDCQFFGVAAGPPHLVNVAFHVLNSLLLFRLLTGLTNSTGRSAMVAALFALHPAHVESVAWIAERKDVLSTLFGLLAIGAYARYGKQALGQAPTLGTSPLTRSPEASGRILLVPCDRNYWIAFLCFALSLMSKPMLVTLPGVLLLLDWWPLQRWSLRESWSVRARIFRQLVIEKWPWLVLSALSCVVTIAAQRSGGAIVSAESHPLPARLANALVGYVRYLGKLIWPSDLAVIYPLPATWSAGETVAAAILLLGVTAIVLRLAGRRAYLPMGWFWFLGTLVPVIGLIQVGGQAMADRYTYFPSIGFFIMVVWAAADFLDRVRVPKLLRGGFAIGLLTGCGIATSAQTRFWKDSVTLFERAVAVTSENAQAQNNLGFSLAEAGRTAEANRHYAEAVRLAPADPLFNKNLGVALAQAGDTNAANVHLWAAITGFLEVAQTRPKAADALNHIGIALKVMGESREAIKYYAEAVRLAPLNAIYRNNLGVALAREGAVGAAIDQLQEAVRLMPEYAEAANNLGVELLAAGRMEEAAAAMQQALRSRPDFAEAHSNLGSALARIGQDESAVAHYTEALRLDPKLMKAQLNLGLSLAKLGKLEAAVTHFTAAISLDGSSVEAAYNLGRCYVLLEQFERATATLTELVNRSPTHAAAHLYLGRAWIGLRQPEPGIKHLRESLRLRPDSLNAISSLAWVLATDPDARVRDGGEAIRLAEPVAGRTDRLQPTLLDALAAAYAEVGRFDAAIATAQNAGDRARATGDTNLVVEIAGRKRLYELHQPFRSGKVPE